jgi:hypothetical protein
MTAEKLSDTQLYALAAKASLSPRLRAIILPEFERRNFQPEYLDELRLNYEHIIPSDNAGLSVGEKALIILVAPTLLLWFLGVPVHCWIVNKYISKGQLRKWQQYWQYITVGFWVWTMVLLLTTKLFLKSWLNHTISPH